MEELQLLSDNKIVAEKNNSEEIYNSFEVETILKAIDESVNKRIDILSKNDSFIFDEDFFKEAALGNHGFVIPKFKRNDKITDEKNYFYKTQKWIGHVIEIRDDEFVAKLEDITKGGTNEIGEFDINEISEEDKSLLKTGATFYWSIGYANEGSQVKKESIIRFQRVFNWDEDDYNESLDRASNLSDKLNWD